MRGGGRNHAMPSTRLGRWSIVVATVALLLLATGAAGLIMAQNQAGTAPSATVLAAAAALWLSRLSNLVGVVLGVIALARRDRHSGAAGLLLNVAMIFGGDWIAGRFALLFAGV